MTSDSVGSVGLDSLSPDGMQELVGTLKATCVEVAAARQHLESLGTSAVQELRSEAARYFSNIQTTAEDKQAAIDLAVNSALGRLAELENRASTLAARVQDEIHHSMQARGRVESALETVSSTLRQVRADRETWEAQGRAEKAKQDATAEELRRALAEAGARVSALERENKHLSDAHGALDGRLTLLEKKKVFGIF